LGVGSLILGLGILFNIIAWIFAYAIALKLVAVSQSGLYRA
jgi:hypothetical protein